MSTTTNYTTAEKLFVMQDDGKRYELIKGKLKVMSPAGGRHGWIAAEIAALLRNHVKPNELGVVFAAETGFLVETNPDTVRAPDVAFVRAEQLESLGNIDGYLPLAPDLAVEVTSPSDSSTYVEDKAQMWIEAGSKLVLVVDPQHRTIRAYRDTSSIEVLHDGYELDASDVVPGWRLKVGDAFPSS